MKTPAFFAKPSALFQALLHSGRPRLPIASIKPGNPAQSRSTPRTDTSPQTKPPLYLTFR
jgi:hypothetical protein